MSRPFSTRTARLSWAAGLAVVGLAGAGCTTATNELNPSQEELQVSATAPLGRIVTDDEGRTVYLFEKDEHDQSYCTGACESVWPPVTTKGLPKIGDGIAAGKVTLLKRENGLRQVVYQGHPLYYYQGDTHSGDTNGQELDQFGAEWYALTPSGDPAQSSAQRGGGGYGS